MAKRTTNSNPVRGTLKPATTAGFSIKKQFRTQIRTELAEKLGKSMAQALPYRTAKLNSSSNPKDWFVYYFHVDPSTGKYKRFKERHGLNDFRKLEGLSAYYHKPVDDVRRTMAQEMIKIIDSNLKAGFNPFAQHAIIYNTQNNPLLPAIETVVEQLCKPATQNSKESYRLMLSRFRKFVKEKGMHEMPVGLFNVDHAKQFQKHLQLASRHSKKTVNTTISHLGKFWDELIEEKKVKENPFRAVKALTDKSYRGLEKENDDDVFEPLTHTEIDQVIKKLKERHDDNFIIFLGFIYYAWARPVEITRLNVADIDLSNKLIHFRKAGTKSRKGAMVQIVPPLMKLLKQLHLEKVQDPSWFVFSKGFKPGPTQLDDSRGVGYLHWNPVVKELNIKKKMYALKHTGNIEYLMQNKGKADLKWQQRQNRHATSSMTEQYNRKLGAYFIDFQDVKFRPLGK
jgi:integrase